MKLRKMLVAIDGSEASSGALDFALKLAHAHSIELFLAFAVDRAAVAARACGPYGAIDPYPLVKALVEEAESVLTSASERALEAGVRATTALLDGPATRMLLECAKEWHVDAIAIGTHGRSGVSRLALGSVAEGVLRASRVPVFVVPKGAKVFEAPRTILVAVDGSDASVAASRCALRIACAGSAPAEVVFCAVVDRELLRWSHAEYSYDPAHYLDEMEADAQRLLEPMLEEARPSGAPVRSMLRCGKAAHEILHGARDVNAELIVIGTHGRTGLGRLLLGSVAEHVLRGSGVPVCVVHSAPLKLVAMRETRDVAAAG